MESPPPGVRVLTLTLSVVLVMSACTSNGGDGPEQAMESGGGAGLEAAVGLDDDSGRPADAGLLRLRVDLAAGLSEHALLYSSAAAARLDGETETYDAYASLVTEDSTLTLSEVMSAVGDPADGDAFRDGWAATNELLLAYIDIAVEGDQVAQQTAREDIEGATAGLAQAFERATALPADEAQSMVRDHLDRLTNVVDAQASEEDLRAYQLVREASSRADALARPLASAAAGDDLTTFPPQSLSVRLHLLLQEHVHLLGLATSAALNGETDQFNAIASVLVEGTAVGLANVVGSAADREAGEAFLADWNEHIRRVVDYTEATATGDRQAVLDALDGLTESLVAIASSLEETTGLPAQTSAAAFAAYLTTVSEILDTRAPAAVDEGQAAPGEEGGTDGEAPATPAAQVAPALLEGARELRGLADPLAESVARTRQAAA